MADETTAHVSDTPIGQTAAPAALESSDSIPGIALHDELSVMQTDSTAAARLSGQHLANLLYPQGSVTLHTSPYGAHYDPNYAQATRAPGSTPEQER